MQTHQTNQEADSLWVRILFGWPTKYITGHARQVIRRLRLFADGTSILRNTLIPK
jgi:hypothetical protein